jgi:hypothetical protein
MDREEARGLLDGEIAALRELAYEGLRARVPRIVRRRRRFLWWPFDYRVLGSPPFEVHDVTGGSGELYQVETNVDWDEEPGGSIRVTAMIDQGGDASMQDGFVIAPDGAITAEEEWEGS